MTFGMTVVRHDRVNDVVKHYWTHNHCQDVTSKSSVSNLDRFAIGQSNTTMKARKKKDEQHLQGQQAEALFVQSVVEHNVSF